MAVSVLVYALTIRDTFPVDPAKDYSLYAGFVHLAAGLACGMTGLAAGYAIGLVGDSVSNCSNLCMWKRDGCPQCVRAYVNESKVFVAMVLILIFAEVLGLYGYVTCMSKIFAYLLRIPRLIVALILNTHTTDIVPCL